MPYPPMYGSNFMCTLDPYMPNVPPPTSNPNEYIQPQRPLNPYPNSSGNTGNNRAYGEYGHQPGFEYNSGNYQPLPYGYYPPPYPSTLPPPPSPYGYQQPVFFLAFFLLFFFSDLYFRSHQFDLLPFEHIYPFIRNCFLF